MPEARYRQREPEGLRSRASWGNSGFQDPDASEKALPGQGTEIDPAQERGLVLFQDEFAGQLFGGFGVHDFLLQRFANSVMLMES